MSRFFIPSLLVVALTACAPGAASIPNAQAEETPQVAQASGDCPQPRKTPEAPSSFLAMKNPHNNSEGIAGGRELYEKTAKPFTCETCHGMKGDGKGDPVFESTPKARNFTCAATMNSLEDGQLFWIIKNGSPRTAMPGFKKNLSDDQIWKLVAYLRTFAR